MFQVYARYLVEDPDCPVIIQRDLDTSVPLKNTELLIYDDTSLDDRLVLIDPKLSLEDSTAGKFEFTMPITNIAYGLIGRMDTEIRVFQNGDEIWRGRVLEEEVDFNNRKSYTCEGALAYMNDTVIPPKEWQNYDIRGLIRAVVDNHNAQCTVDNSWPLNKHITLGVILIQDNRKNEEYLKEINNNPYVTNFEKSLEVLNTLVEKFHGHICMSYSGEDIVLNIYDELKFGPSAGQTIDFGKNLLDFTKNYDMSNIATVVLPLGKLPDDFKPRDKMLMESKSGVAQFFQPENYRHTVTAYPDTIITKWRDGLCDPLLSVSQFYTIHMLQVTPGKKYSLTCRLPSNMVAAAFYTANLECKSTVKHDGGTTRAPGEWYRKIITIPSDCSYVSITSYGGWPSLIVATEDTNPGEIEGDQTQEVKVADDEQDTVYDDYGYNSILEYCGYDESQSSSGSSIPNFSDIAEWNSDSGTYVFHDPYSDSTNQYEDPQQTDEHFVAYGITKNRQRYVLYKVRPMPPTGGQNLPGKFLIDSGLVRPDAYHGTSFDTVKITFNRPIVNGKESQDDIKFYLDTRMDYNFYIYVILDEYGTIMSSKAGTEAVDDNAHTRIKDELITVPYEGKTVYICGERGQTELYSYNPLYDKADMHLTVEEVNNGDYFVRSPEAILNHGWIVKNIEFEVEDKETLLSKAEQYLQDVQFDDMELNVTAVDLAYINPSLRPFKIYEVVRCLSTPHGLNKQFPVIGIDLPLDSPDQVKYTLGENLDKHEYTEATNDIVADLMEKINAIPTRESVLVEAKENATNIMKQYCHGYVTIVEDDPRFGSCIYISDNEDYMASNRHWLWNLNGLGYSKDGGATYGLAMTMDGSIVADFITAGTLSADRIRTGLLVDIEGKNYWNLETGDIALGLNLKTTYIEDAQDYYGENGARWPTSDNNIELGSWIYDRTNHEYNFKTVFGSGVNMVDGIYSYSGTVDETDSEGHSTGRHVQEKWYNPKTSRYETRDKKFYWLYISASVISTGLLKSRNGRLFFDLDTGALWCAGVDKVALDSHGDVIYYNDGTWGAEPTSIAKHIQFVEGALYGFSRSTFSGQYTTYNVDEEYSLKNNNSGEDVIDYSNGNRMKHDLFRTGHIRPGTLEGYLDLVTSYTNVNEGGGDEYDCLLAGSNRVHINFGNKLLIGKAANLFDNSPEVIIYGESGKVSIGDPNVFKNYQTNPIVPGAGGSRKGTGVVNLEVYGDTQIGHKYDRDNGETAPPKADADKYKADLTVYGSATFGRNYYTEEVTEEDVEVTAGTQTSWQNGHLIATTGEGTVVPKDLTPAEQAKKKVKKYYDDVVFHANVKIDSASGIEDLEILKVKKYMIIGTDYEDTSVRDTSWKFNDGKFLDTTKSSKLNDTDTTSYYQENAIYGNMLVNGRVQFSGGLIAGVGSRMILGHPEKGSTATDAVPYSVDGFKISRRYELVGPGALFDLTKQRFIVEGNSLFYGNLQQLEGNVGVVNLSVRDFYIGLPDSSGSGWTYPPTYVFDVGRYGTAHIPKGYLNVNAFFITSKDRDQVYAQTAVNGIYIEEENNPLTIHLDTPILYEGTSTDGLLINPSAPSHAIKGASRPAQAAHLVTVRGGLVVRGYQSDGTSGSLSYTYAKIGYDGSYKLISASNPETIYAELDTNGLFTGKAINVTRYNNLQTTAGNTFNIASGDILGRNLYLLNSNASGIAMPTITLNAAGDGIFDGMIKASSFKVYTTGTYGGNIIKANTGQLDANGICAKQFYIRTVGEATGAASDILTINNDRAAYLTKISLRTTGSTDAVLTTVSLPYYTTNLSSAMFLNCTMPIKTTRIDATCSVDNTCAILEGMVAARSLRLYDPSLNKGFEITSAGYVYGPDNYKIIDGTHNIYGSSYYVCPDGTIQKRMLYYNTGNSKYCVSADTLFAGTMSINENQITCNSLQILNAYGNNMLNLESGGKGTFNSTVYAAGFFVKKSDGSYPGSIDADGRIYGSSLGVGTGAITGGAITGTSLNVGTGSITAGAISGSSLNTNNGSINCGSILSTGSITGSSFSTTGSITGGSLSLGGGTISCGTINCGSISGASLNVGDSGGVTCGNLRAWKGATIGWDGNNYGTIIYGYCTINGQSVQTSDKRLKKNIKPLEFDGLAMVKSIKVKSFDWKKSGYHVNYGFIAQDVQEKDKFISKEEKTYNIVKEDSHGNLGIDYNQMTAVLWKAVQELSAQVDELKAEIKQLKSA